MQVKQVSLQFRYTLLITCMVSIIVKCVYLQYYILTVKREVRLQKTSKMVIVKFRILCFILIVKGFNHVYVLFVYFRFTCLGDCFDCNWDFDWDCDWFWLLLPSKLQKWVIKI